MMSRLSFPGGLLIALVLLFGCKREHWPEGLPKLTPCKITVINVDGAPLAGASVSLRSSGEPIPWATIGETNKEGVAELAVNAKYKGAPPGTYKVLIYKQESIDKTRKLPVFPPEVFVSLEHDTAYYINPIYANETKTPFELTVIDGKVVEQTFTIDRKADKKLPTPL